MSNSQNIFDNPVFFDGYRELRRNRHSANELEEKPALFSLSPDLTGKAVLDLGCGYGENCAEFKSLGAARVLGVDISEKMLAVACEENPEIEFIRADMSDLSFLDEKFDVVFSSLAVHYVEDFPSFVKDVYGVLNEGGCFIFSQEHPLTTAPIWGASWMRDENGEVLHYKLTDYGRPGFRSTKWFVEGVEKYHRRFSDIVNSLCEAGFVIEKMIETTPDEEIVKIDKSWEKDFHKPNFLLIKARK